MKKAKVILVIGILATLMGSMFVVENLNNSHVLHENFGVLKYTPHGVIRINSNADFDTSHGVVGGSGTQNDPYIISGYDIDAHGAGDAIYIGNTTAYFIVENCYLHNTSYHSGPYFYGDGITLYKVGNGTIKNNTVSNNQYYGIYLYFSIHNDVIENNNFSLNNSDGIYLYFSNNTAIENNTISNNNNAGIYLDCSSSNMIENNTISNNKYYGIYIYSSNNPFSPSTSHFSINNTLYNNTMIGDGIFIWGVSLKHYTANKITTNNTVNGKPVYFWKNKTSGVIPQGAGEIILANCSHILVDTQELTNGSIGIESAYSSNITINNNTISNNGNNGIYFYYSNDTVIENNIILNNGNNGIYFYYSNRNMIKNNTCSNNGGSGIYFYSSNNNVIENNTITLNNNDGIYLMALGSSNNNNNNVIENNTISLNNNGIYMFSFFGGSNNNNVIKHNLLFNNTHYGVYVYSGSNNLIYNNSFYYNNGSGDTFNSLYLQAYNTGTGNYWNTTSGIGNYWHDWANNNNSNDNDNNGIVDWSYNLDGSGKDSYPLKNPTYLIPPLAPQNLQATAGDGFVNITWQKPLNGSTPITGYRIYRNGTYLADVSASQLYYNDTGVSNGVTYTYYVTAVNSVGESDKSSEVQATPQGAVPEFSTGIYVAVLIIIALLGMMRFRKFS